MPMRTELHYLTRNCLH